ncbi:MAG: prolyl oligopeptidase family serine peptidase [Rhizomicrobium sp.]|jgi:dienelactone hydrolase
MVRYWGAVCAGVLACGSVLISFQVALADPLPVDVYGSLPLLIDAQISPNGNLIGVIGDVNGVPGAAVLSLVDPAMKPKIATLDNAAVGDFLWANDNRLLCTFYSNFKDKHIAGIHQHVRVVSVAMDGAPAVILMNNRPTFQSYFSNGVVLARDPSDSNYVLMESFQTNAEMNGDAPLVFDQDYLNLFQVNVNTGMSGTIWHGNKDTNDVLVDGSGHVVATLQGSVDDYVQHIMVGNREVGSFNVRGGGEWDLKGITFDQQSIAVLAYGSNGTADVFSYKLGANGLGTPLFADPKYDVEEVLKDPSSLLVDGVSYADDRTRFRYFDPAKEHLREKLEAALGGESVKIVSHDAAGSKYAIYAEGPKDPGTYYIFDTKTSHLDEFRRQYPKIGAGDIAEVKPYPYKSVDGLDINAYLTLPQGKSARNLPTVIFPHGGPEYRDRITFDFVAQFLASRGYAVLQPNFRGSSGYGTAFHDAGFGEWGGKVLDDINAGAKKLIADGIADPKRVCIVGESFGGYAALADVTFHPDQFACAVSYAGISDLAKMRYYHVQQDGNNSVSVTVWDKFMGGSDVSKHESDASPVEHADQVKAPVLLIHSQNDVTVPIEQSEDEESALKGAGKQVEFVKLEGDDHNLHLEKARIQYLTEVEKFLKAHIGN